MFTKKRVAVAGRQTSSALTVSDIVRLAEYTLESAAAKQKISPTILKKLARKAGVARWPFRQYMALTKQFQRHEPFTHPQNFRYALQLFSVARQMDLDLEIAIMECRSQGGREHLLQEWNFYVTRAKKVTHTAEPSVQGASSQETPLLPAHPQPHGHMAGYLQPLPQPINWPAQPQVPPQSWQPIFWSQSNPPLQEQTCPPLGTRFHLPSVQELMRLPSRPIWDRGY